jgi:hypothetical protein
VLGVGAPGVAAAAWVGYGPMGGAWWPPAAAAGAVLAVAGIVLAIHSQAHAAMLHARILPLTVEFARETAGPDGALRFLERPDKDFLEVPRLARLGVFPGDRYRHHGFRRGLLEWVLRDRPTHKVGRYGHNKL